MYNASSDSIAWSCAQCEDAFYFFTNFRYLRSYCFGSMPNLVGKNLCLRNSTTGRLWDLEMTYWQSGRETGTRLSSGIGGFAYYRSGADEDGIGDVCDNCPGVNNPGQEDTDGNGEGDACTADIDGDGVNDTSDNCPSLANAGQANSDFVSVAYTHAADVGLSEEDCLYGDTSICFSRDLTGPMINTGTGTHAWYCGTCDNTTGAGVAVVTDLRDTCLDGFVPNLVGTSVCLAVDATGDRWDFDFSSYQSGGGGGFAYTRTLDDGFGDACDVCWSVYDPAQADSDSNCPAAPYSADPVCGDACQP
jgi:hypothetical protein